MGAGYPPLQAFPLVIQVFQKLNQEGGYRLSSFAVLPTGDPVFQKLNQEGG